MRLMMNKVVAGMCRSLKNKNSRCRTTNGLKAFKGRDNEDVLMTLDTSIVWCDHRIDIESPTVGFNSTQLTSTFWPFHANELQCEQL